MSLVLRHPLENQGFALTGILSTITGFLAASFHVLELRVPEVTDLTLESVSLRTFLVLCCISSGCLLIANLRTLGSKLRPVMRRWSLASLNGGVRAGYVSSVAMAGYGLGGLVVVAPFGTPGDVAGALRLMCLGALILLIAFLWFYALGSELGIVPMRMKVRAWFAAGILATVLVMADAFLVAMLTSFLVALAFVLRWRCRSGIGCGEAEQHAAPDAPASAASPLRQGRG